MTDPQACSRCGTATGQHTTKCLQAMALAWAMGVEERPRVGPVRVEVTKTINLGQEAEIAELVAERDELRAEIDRLHAEMDLLGEKLLTAQAEAEAVRAEVDRLLAARHAEIDAEIESPAFQRELEQMAASPHLEVEVHDEANATVRPKVDETPPAPEPAQEAAPAAPASEASTPPMTASNAEWAAFVKDLRARLGLTKMRMAQLIGCSAPTYRAWEQGTFLPGPRWQEKLRTLSAGERPPGVTSQEAEIAESRLKSAETLRAGVSGPVVQFLEDLVDRTAPADAYLAAPDLMAAYAEWRKIKGAPVLTPRKLGMGLRAAGLTNARQAKKAINGSKPVLYFGVRWLKDKPAETPTPAPAAIGAREPEPVSNQAQVDEVRDLMKRARAQAARVEKLDEPAIDVPAGPDELAVKLAQLKVFGIGGEHGVSKAAANAAVADLHPTGNDVWKWVAPANVVTGGKEVSDSELDATAYQLLVKCMNGLPEEYGYDYKEDVLATAGFVQEDVDAALRSPQRVEIRPESWDKEKRYPVLGFHRGDVTVILGMRTPTKPRVIAAYWQAQLQADTYHVDRHGGGGSRKSSGLPTSATASFSRLRTMGCEFEGDPIREKSIKVLYKGQDLGKVTCGTAVPKPTVQSDYQRTLRKMQAIDRREEAKVG